MPSSTNEMTMKDKRRMPSSTNEMTTKDKRQMPSRCHLFC
jgi:hypothetical protein